MTPLRTALRTLQRTYAGGVTLVEVALALAVLGSVAAVTLVALGASARGNRVAALQARRVDVAAEALSRWRAGVEAADACALDTEPERLGFECVLEVHGCSLAASLVCASDGGASLEQASVTVRSPDSGTLTVAALRFRSVGAGP